MLRQIPPQSSVSANGVLVPHLSGRRHVYNYPNPFYPYSWGATVQALEQQQDEHFDSRKMAEYHKAVNSAPVEYVALYPQINRPLA